MTTNMNCSILNSATQNPFWKHFITYAMLIWYLRYVRIILHTHKIQKWLNISLANELSASLNFNYVLMCGLLFWNQIEAIIPTNKIIFTVSQPFQMFRINPRDGLIFFDHNDVWITLNLWNKKKPNQRRGYFFFLFLQSMNGVILHNNFLFG